MLCCRGSGFLEYDLAIRVGIRPDMVRKMIYDANDKLFHGGINAMFASHGGQSVPTAGWIGASIAARIVAGLRAGNVPSRTVPIGRRLST